MTSWPTLNLYAAFNQATSTLDPTTWDNLAAYVQALTIRRGASTFDTPPVRYEAGTLAAVLANDDARFDPTNLSGPYVTAGVTEVKPMRRIAVQVVWDSVTYQPWQGYADDWTPTYPLRGKQGVTALRATDGMGIWARADLPQYNVIDTTSLDTRGRLLQWLQQQAPDEPGGLGWEFDLFSGSPDPGRELQGVTTLAGNVLAGMQLAVDSDGGELYIDGESQAHFRDRHAIVTETRSNTSQATFGPAGSLPFRDVVLRYDGAQVRNDISVGRVGGTVQRVIDQDSQDEYTRRTFSRTDLMMTTDDEALDYAGYLRRLLKDPELRVDRLVIDPQSAPATLFPQLLTRELGDRITVEFTPPGGSAISRDCFIRGIEHVIGVRPASWQTTYTLQDASRFNFLVFDHATLGKLDENALGM